MSKKNKSTPTRMVAEYISDQLDAADRDADIFIEYDAIVTVAGENTSGLAIYNHDSKSFRFFYATNTEIALSGDDDEVYSETGDLKTFCDRMCE